MKFTLFVCVCVGVHACVYVSVCVLLLAFTSFAC